MKTKSNFLVMTAALACAAMVSCNVNDDINDAGNEAVRFTAGIDQQAVATPGTRAAGDTWGSGDAIGIFMAEGTTTHYANSQYATTENGVFTAVGGREMYYPQNGEEADFIAYYPYESGAVLATPIDVEIATDQTLAGIQPTFDLLYSSDAKGKKATASTPIVLAFEHKLAKIVMNVKADASVTASLDGMTVMINGMFTKNTFNLSTGALGAVNTKAAITPRVITTANNYDASYDAIIMPYGYAANELTVEFTLTNGDVHTWKLDAAEDSFSGGNEYTYAITLIRRDVLVESSVAPWNALNNYRDNIEAD